MKRKKNHTGAAEGHFAYNRNTFFPQCHYHFQSFWYFQQMEIYVIKN